MFNSSWQIKRNFNTMVSTSQIDAIFDGAMENGACGGKLLGAEVVGAILYVVR